MKKRSFDNNLRIIVLGLLILTMALGLFACKDKPSPSPSQSTMPYESISPKPSDNGQTQEPEPLLEYREFNNIMLFQEGIQVFPLPKDAKNLSMMAEDGFTISFSYIENESSLIPIYDARSTTSLNKPFVPLPNLGDSTYLVWNQHKFYILDLKEKSFKLLLKDYDGTITFKQALEGNKANGLYWGTKPVISEDGKYLLYLTNRRNNGKTNDIRLYDFESKEDILLIEDFYYTHASFYKNTIFLSLEDRIMRIDLNNRVLSPLSYSTSVNGFFADNYYVYTSKYYQEFEILNLLTLESKSIKMGNENSAIKFSPNPYNKDITSIILLNGKKVTLNIYKISTQEILKTYVLGDSFTLLYSQWQEENVFSLSGYEEDINEKTFLLTY